MVRYFYATKTEFKYKSSFPKAKKKVAKVYKPAPMPDFREMFDYLMATCDQKSTFKKLPCLICRNNVNLFGHNLPNMRPEKEKLRRMIAAEQAYREKMPICNKCYNVYKKSSMRCPVGECGNGRRRNKPSRALPSEFVEMPLEEQCLIVRKFHFHPSTPKICNNCYKRIMVEVKCIQTGSFTLDDSLSDSRATDNKKLLKWTYDRVEALFQAVTDTDKNWDTVSTSIYAEGFKPSARQCRAVYIKLCNYWRIKKRRAYLERSSRRFRHVYRRVRRMARVKRNKNRKLRKIKERRSVRKQKDESQSEANANADTTKQELPVPPESKQEVINTQNVPVSCAPPSIPSTGTAPLLANFIPTTSQSSNPNTLSNQMSIYDQLKDEKWAQYLSEELGLSKDASAAENAVEIGQRVSLMTSQEFDLLTTRLQIRAHQNQETIPVSRFKHMHGHQINQQPREQNLQFDKTQLPANQTAHVGQMDNSKLTNATSSTIIHYLSDKKADPATEELRQTTSVERPNRKTGLANVMLESNTGGFRSRTHTIQKINTNRPSSAFDGQKAAAISAEPAEPDAEEPKLRQNRIAYPVTQRPIDSLNAAATATAAAINEPVYESLSDDDDISTSKSLKESNISSLASQFQKTVSCSIYTIFGLVDQEKTSVPTYSNNLTMPAIENLKIAMPYQEFSD